MKFARKGPWWLLIFTLAVVAAELGLDWALGVFR